MKRLFLNATFNPKYVGPDHTPNIPNRVFQVAKVVNSVEPSIGATLQTDEVNGYCNRDDWDVTIT